MSFDPLNYKNKVLDNMSLNASKVTASCDK